MYRISADRLDQTARAVMERRSSAVWERMPPILQGKYREEVISVICAAMDIPRTEIEIVSKTSDIIAPSDDRVQGVSDA